MTNGIVERIAVPTIPAPDPSAIGQATHIESRRATAEVEAAVFLARQFPRNTAASIRSMQESCGVKEMADRAYYRYRRGGSNVTGLTIHAARELARCWGNIQYNLVELSRDKDAGSSQMLAYAWDLETNVRAAQITVTPHMRDTKDGGTVLTDARDVYENNTNQGARRLRQQILAILPPWFVEMAKAGYDRTLREGGGKPLAQRVATIIDWYGSRGVTLSQLVDKIGANSTEWTVHDVTQLEVIGSSIARGEVSKDEEFPPARVTADEITRQPNGGKPKLAVDMGGADPSNDVTVPTNAATKPSGWGDDTQVAQPGSGVRKARQS